MDSPEVLSSSLDQLLAGPWQYSAAPPAGGEVSWDEYMQFRTER